MLPKRIILNPLTGDELMLVLIRSERERIVSDGRNIRKERSSNHILTEMTDTA